MTSEKQIEANRENAQKSTGPNTPEGKAVTSMNATKHGLLSRKVLLPDESPTEFDEFAGQVKDYLSPVGKLEESLVDRIVFLFWRLQRLEKVEAGFALWNYFERMASEARREAETHVKASGGIDDWLKSIGPSEKRTIIDEEKHMAALERAKEAHLEKEKSASCFARSFMNDNPTKGKPAFERLSRYENSLERSLFRALKEFRDLQRFRENHD